MYTQRFLYLILFSLSSLLLHAKDEVLDSLLKKYPKTEVVKTGIYLLNVYELDINTHSFNADFYIWFKWKGERNPCNIEFVNSVQKWSITKTDFYEEPILLSDGYYYNGARIESRFFHPFELGQFPLDKHDLSIHIENVDFPIDSIVYIPDSNAVFVRENLKFPGWNSLGVSTNTQNSLYPTNFGETGRRSLSFSNFTFQLSLARPASYFILKLFLPLFIVILVALGALFISPEHTDARISVTIGALLAVVFLQQSYGDALPDVGYMVLMDKIYLLVYILVSSIMLRSILAANRVVKSSISPEEIALIRRKDLKLAFWLFILLTIGVLILLLF